MNPSAVRRPIPGAPAVTSTRFPPRPRSSVPPAILILRVLLVRQQRHQPAVAPRPALRQPVGRDRGAAFGVDPPDDLMGPAGIGQRLRRRPVVEAAVARGIVLD